MINWEKLFEIGFKKSKESIKERYTLEEDGSGDSGRVAVRKIAERMPFPVKILELKIDSDKYEHIKDKICPMCYYDISKHNSNEIKNLGRVFPDEDKFVKILREEFHMKEPEKFVEDFNKKMDITGIFSSDLKENMQFFFYDPRNDVDKFNWDFIQMMERSIVSVLAYSLKTEPDYNQKYQLGSDKIFSEKELLKKYSIRGFTSTVTDYQNDMSNIQLIPQVNEHVKKQWKEQKNYIFLEDMFMISLL